MFLLFCCEKGTSNLNINGIILKHVLQDKRRIVISLKWEIASGFITYYQIRTMIYLMYSLLVMLYPTFLCCLIS